MDDQATDILHDMIAAGYLTIFIGAVIVMLILVILEK